MADVSTQWQPIASAPKDGTRILVWHPTWLVPEVREWLNDEWYSPYGGKIEDPLYWCVLPPPPEPEWKDRTVQFTVTVAGVTSTHEATFKILAAADEDELDRVARQWWVENFRWKWKEI